MLINQNKNSIYTILDWVIVICLVFSAYASIVSENLNSIALYIAIPLAFGVSFLLERKIFPNVYEKTLLTLCMWVSLSYIWAVHKDAASVELHRMLGVFTLSYCMAVNGNRKQMIPWMYVSFVFVYIGAWVYASINMLIVSDITYGERMNDNRLNANTMAYYTFYVTFIFYILSEIINKRYLVVFFRWLFIAMIPLSFYVALITASRQVLIVQIPLFALLLWLRYLKRAKLSRKAIFIFLCIIAFIFLIPSVESIYESSYLASRSKEVIADDSRILLLEDALAVGTDNFFFGVGAGNFRFYSRSGGFAHNTYAELYANTGFLGFYLYFVLILRFLLKQWKRYKMSNDKMFLIFLSFGLIYVIDQFFYVFYVDIWLISFFILVATHSDYYFKEKKHENITYSSGI